MRLGGKTAVVTGGASGIGRAVVEAFVREGARVAVVDRAAEAAGQCAGQLRVSGGEAFAVAGDVGSQDTWQEVSGRVMERWGRLDVLVNNAGYGIRATVTDTSWEDWQAIVSTNVSSVFLGCRTAIPLMRKAGAGSVVNMASVAGQIGMAERAAYCATKAAVVGLSKAMAVDHASEGIRVNCVAPGTTDTPYFAKISRHLPDEQAYRADLAARQPLGRLGRPEEIAAAVVFLASDESSFATGSVLTVDGGMSVW
ncbi:SDR family oxidoreductase [Streptomyces sp. RB6PN25]|uniref:SDR family oxidoreductase n=1 Tax=Streptomyces humicola TaxID=2953240 RepID=A0ABT1PWB4_9ACTN|nr:SDR family oxidoreductase [Streptomyces humicola]MCQ4080857.1 SDR family oxidoreductase [Streptomyces humicola]